MIAGSAEGRLLDVLLELCRGRGWLKARDRQRTDATHVLARVRSLGRLECVVETMRHALNGLAAADPGWLRRHARGEWVEPSRWPTSRRAACRHQHGTTSPNTSDGSRLASMKTLMSPSVEPSECSHFDRDS